MTLLGNAGTSNMGEAMQRAYSVLKADGTFEVMKFVLEQWAIHSVYRRNFNAIDMHNSKRQGPTCFEDTWKTHRWWIREIQMLIGMSEINAFLLWKRFKPGQHQCSPDFFRKMLVHEMMYHPIRMREIGERHALRSHRPVDSHHLLLNPVGETLRGRCKRRRCRYCSKRRSTIAHVALGWRDSCACSCVALRRIVSALPSTMLASCPPTSGLLPWHSSGWQGRLQRRLER